MPKCPHCARPLHKGIRCRACRRYVLGWPYVALIAAFTLIIVVGFLELLFRFI